MTKKTRRRYSDEFKAEAVNMVRGEGYAISEAARRLDIDRSLLDRWCRQQRDREDGVTDDQADERDAEILVAWGVVTWVEATNAPPGHHDRAKPDGLQRQAEPSN